MPVEEFTLVKFIKLATRPEKDRPIHTMSFDSIPDSYIEFFQEEKLVFNILQCLDQFRVIGFLLFTMKTSKNLWLSDVFRGYRKRP